MPWKEVTQMSAKLEFVRFALEESVSFVELCRRFKISRKTGYKLLKRYQEEGEKGLLERSKKPHSSLYKTDESIEEKVTQLRQKRPSWGGRKIRGWLLNHEEKGIPAASTITDILRRHGYIHEEDSKKREKFKRFEHEAANDLWQIDFKGHFEMRQGRCHALTILDDHSRFSIALKGCQDERGKTIKPHFIKAFEEYGLPWRINFDNGSPWSGGSQSRYTEFSIWLMRLGIRVSFSRPRHPQTNGKDERFHRTLKNELLRYHYFWNISEAQRYFDDWRKDYNYERPHEALSMKPPISRYHVSKRKYPAYLPEMDYLSTDEIRKVNVAGTISYKNRKIFIGEGFRGLPVALRERDKGEYDIYFCHQKIQSIDFKQQV
jgi:transposase InsO family protein